MIHNNTAVIYMRLSQDDRLDESLSITNQRAIINHFCETRSITVVEEFIDDGFSGGNFDRPGFKAMIEYIKSHHVDQVITKDLSRLGRDMTESSFYAERFFPDNGIIFQTATGDYSSLNDNLYAPFQFAMNDVYIRDASKKIKTVLSHKRNRGEYCACPPFGYKKSRTNRNKLEPDEATAPIVRLIFQYSCDGWSTGAIADFLTNAHMITPLQYRVTYRDEFGEKGATRATDKWNYTTVKRIIQNPVYTGATVLGKTRKASPKSKVKIPVPKEQWAVTNDTHEALVTTEIFELANDRLRRRSTRFNEKIQSNGGYRVSIFRGLVFCKNCGSSMCSCGSVYNNDHKSYWYLSCLNIPKRSVNHCEHGARIRYQTLVDLVTQELNSFICLDDDQISEILKNMKDESVQNSRNEIIKRQCDEIQKEILDSNKIVEKLYRDNISGKISDDRFDVLLAATEEKTKQLNTSLLNLQSQITNDDYIENYERFFELAKSYSKIETLTSDIVNAFIDRIEIGEQSDKGKHKAPVTQDIKIFYKFIGELAG